MKSMILDKQIRWTNLVKLILMTILTSLKGDINNNGKNGGNKKKKIT